MRLEFCFHCGHLGQVSSQRMVDLYPAGLVKSVHGRNRRYGGTKEGMISKTIHLANMPLTWERHSTKVLNSNEYDACNVACLTQEKTDIKTTSMEKDKFTLSFASPRTHDSCNLCQ